MADSFREVWGAQEGLFFWLAFSCLSAGRTLDRGSRSFHRRGAVHASMQAFESEQLARWSYGSSRGGNGSSSRSQQQLYISISCYTCGDQSHMMRKCPILTHSRPQYSLVAPTKDLVLPAK